MFNIIDDKILYFFYWRSNLHMFIDWGPKSIFDDRYAHKQHHTNLFKYLDIRASTRFYNKNMTQYKERKLGETYIRNWQANI